MSCTSSSRPRLALRERGVRRDADAMYDDGDSNGEDDTWGESTTDDDSRGCISGVAGYEYLQSGIRRKNKQTMHE